MSLATIATQLLNEAGVTAEDILRDAGVDRAGAVKTLAERLGVDLNDLVDGPDLSRGTPVEVSDADVAKIREGLATLGRIFA